MQRVRPGLLLNIDRQLRARCGRRAAANEGSVTFATGGQRRLHTDLL